MLETVSALWRIEFRTDASKADGLTIPLGFMRESCAGGDGRFLGLIFRPSLTPLECDRVNLNTWPELGGEQLEKFMNDIFDRAWAHSCDAIDGVLGTHAIATNYSGQSALAFVGEPVRQECTAENWHRLQVKLHESLFDHEESLSPVLSAPVLPLRRRAPQPDLPELAPAEIMLKAA